MRIYIILKSENNFKGTIPIKVYFPIKEKKPTEFVGLISVRFNRFLSRHHKHGKYASNESNEKRKSENGK